MRQIPTGNSVSRYANETVGVAKTAEGQMIFKSIISVREASWATTPPKILLRSAIPATGKSISMFDARSQHNGGSTVEAVWSGERPQPSTSCFLPHDILLRLDSNYKHEVPVAGFALLFTMNRTLAGVHVERDVVEAVRLQLCSD